MKTSSLSRLSPCLMSRETLEAIFVQREPLAQRLVELIRDSTLTAAKHQTLVVGPQGIGKTGPIPTAAKHHTLLIGPHGIGKTHLISLVYHRIRAAADLHGCLLIAWLREEEWGVTSFLDLFLRIFRALLAEHADPVLSEQVESLYDLPSDEAARAAGQLLKQYVGSRTLLLLIENLDDILGGLGDQGQQRLRSFWQENPFCTLLASAESLFNAVSLQTSPFYGFFRIQHLRELELDDAALLLTKIAALDNDPDLESFLQTPAGRARVRAVHHLAGGSPRTYLILAQFLTRDTLDALAEPVIRTLDGLTPCYQARIARLSPQQRKIIDFLCDRRHDVLVKEIAQCCFLTHQTVSSQLKELRDRGYVRSHPIGRESYYELRDPLMRLCYEVRKQRGELVRLSVDFLRSWYQPEGLHWQLAPRQSSDARALGLRIRDRTTEARATLNRAVKLSDRSSQLLFKRAEALLALDRWDEGSAVLGEALCRFAHSDEPEVGDTEAIVCNVLNKTPDLASWRIHISTLIDLYDRHHILAPLGRGLVRSIRPLMSPLVNCAAARMWLDLWRQAAADRAEMRLPLRLLDVAVRYRQAHDPRVLFDLPVEERSLLQPLLGIEPGAGSS
ncbi:MAG: MarR family transcriptional regulator [Dehalococcoidia bacterium]